MSKGQLWMACALCARLHLVWSRDPRSAADRLAYVDHIVALHPHMIPAWQPDCGRCTQYREAMELPSSITAPTVRDMLRRIGLEHRADAHLLELPETRAA